MVMMIMTRGLFLHLEFTTEPKRQKEMVAQVSESVSDDTAIGAFERMMRWKMKTKKRKMAKKKKKERDRDRDRDRNREKERERVCSI